ncbi:MAG TPA: hypothetical protein VFV78_09490 [Vicinamibacterales bacterium]|nr:hypothetical protein [Vicinamibacterales bacterium]
MALTLAWSGSSAAQGEGLELSCGAVPRQTTPAALRQKFGPDSLREAAGADGRPVAYLFPNTPEKRIEVIWADASRSALASFMVWDRTSSWKTPQGVKLGLAIADVAELNGRPFILRGFSKEDAGAVITWMNGKLTELDAGACHVAVRLTPPPDLHFTTLEWRLAEIVQDANEVSSDDRRIKPYKAAVSALGLEWYRAPKVPE